MLAVGTQAPDFTLSDRNGVTPYRPEMQRR